MPPGSARDSFCSTLVEPPAPRLLLSAVPLALSLGVGMVALRAGRDSLLLVAAWLPTAVAWLGILAWLVL